MRRLAVLFAASALFAAPTKVDVVQLWNDLATQSAVWVTLQQEVERTPGISPIRSQRQWEIVRRAFHEVDVAVRAQ